MGPLINNDIQRDICVMTHVLEPERLLGNVTGSLLQWSSGVTMTVVATVWRGALTGVPPLRLRSLQNLALPRPGKAGAEGPPITEPLPRCKVADCSFGFGSHPSTGCEDAPLSVLFTVVSKHTAHSKYLIGIRASVVCPSWL